jgi:hypothetical protein
MNAKAAIPALLCLVALLYCCWSVHQLRHAIAHPAEQVEVTFPDTNGVVITPIERPPATQ